MTNKRIFLWVGLALFLIGGGILAWFGGDNGTAVGTVIGVAGIGMMGWAWMTGRGEES
jgi:hypothetical protein